MEQTSSINNFFDLRIDEESRGTLLTITKWAKGIAILGFISPVVSILITLFSYRNLGAYGMGYAIGVTLIGWVIGTAVTVVLNMFLYKFATRAAESLETMNQDTFTEGASNLRYFFKMMGILIIVALAFAVLAIIFLMGVGMLRS